MKDGKRYFEVRDADCVGCNLCAVVCPIENCITLDPMPQGSIDPRSGYEVKGHRTWQEHPNNPMAAHPRDPAGAFHGTTHRSAGD